MPALAVGAWTIPTVHTNKNYCWLSYAKGSYLWILTGTMGLALIVRLKNPSSTVVRKTFGTALKQTAPNPTSTPLFYMEGFSMQHAEARPKFINKNAIKRHS